MQLIQLKQVIELLLPKKRNFQTLLSLGTPSDALIGITRVGSLGLRDTLTMGANSTRLTCWQD